MAVSEGLVINGVDVNDGTNYVLRGLGFPVPKKRPEWIQGADADGSALVRDPLFENREIPVRLRVNPLGALTMDQTLAKVGTIVDQLEEAERQTDGLPVIWTPAQGTKSLTFYALSGEITDNPIEKSTQNSGWFLRAPVLGFTLACKPFGYGAAVTCDPISSVGPALTYIPGALLNLFENPSCEVSATFGGVATTNATLARATSPAPQSGSGIFQLTASSAADMSMQNSGRRSPVRGSISYTASAYFRTAVTARSCNVAIQWFDSSGASISTSTGGNITDATGSWTRATVSATSPANAVTAQVICKVVAPALSEVHYADAIQLEQAASASAYFDGSVAGAIWTSTPNDSSSQKAGTVVSGDAPAEARLQLTDGSTRTRNHVEWGQEWRYFDPTQPLVIDSDSLVVSGFSGAQTTRTGAYDPDQTGNNVIRATLTPSAAAVCGLGNLGHVGTYRVKARVFVVPIASAATTTQVRLSWKEGDGPLRSNDFAATPTFAVNARFFELDLGLVAIPANVLGTQRWTGQIEAYSTTTGDLLEIDYIELIPVDAGYGKGRLIVSYDSPLAVANDDFAQTAGNLTGKTLPIGGTWTVATNSNANDFTLDTSGHTAQRTAVSDADLDHPRMVYASGLTAVTDALLQIDLKTSANEPTCYGGVFARCDGTVGNAVAARVSLNEVRVSKWVGGTRTDMVTEQFATAFATGAYLTVRLLAAATGFFYVWVFTTAGVPRLVAEGWDADLATGGTLASGRCGLLDEQTAATANTRNYDNFIIAKPASDAVIYSGKLAEIRSDVAQRQDASGSYYGNIQTYRGSRLYLPPGAAGRSSRLFVKGRRNDVDLFKDDQITDSLIAQVIYTPRYIAVPR